MKIFLLLNQPYPHGYALTKRFHLYAKGFVENGQAVKILIPKPTDSIKKPLNNSTAGVYNDIEYKYFWKHTTRSESFIIRRWHDFYGVLITGIYIIKEKPDIVITSTFPNIALLYWKVVTLFLLTKFIREKNEVDYVVSTILTEKQIKKAKYKNIVFDGFIFINKQLKNYNENILKINKPSIIIPILVRDFTISNSKIQKKTIVYTGTYVERKDGIITMLKAFSKLLETDKDFKLVLTGSPENSPDYMSFKQTIRNYKLENNIHITGYLNEIELQKLISTSEILLATKPDNRQNRYNFPTKLGDYLITSRPVLSTKVGTVGDLFKEQENIFFTAFNTNCIADKIKYIVKNTEIANQTGARGRRFALKEFSYIYQTKRLIDFFTKLK
jgi:glycosyltransferase involved in cell wall biosynthesis